MAWTRLSLIQVVWWNLIQTKLKLGTIDHVGPGTHLISVHASILTSRPSRLLAKACLVPSHRHEQFQAIPSHPSNSKPVKQREVYRQGVAKCASTMLGPLRLDLIIARTCSRFAWLIVQRQEVHSRVVWCLGPPTYIRILGNASEKLLYPPKVLRCASRMTCALQIDVA